MSCLSLSLSARVWCVLQFLKIAWAPNHRAEKFRGFPLSQPSACRAATRVKRALLQQLCRVSQRVGLSIRRTGQTCWSRRHHSRYSMLASDSGPRDRYRSTLSTPSNIKNRSLLDDISLSLSLKFFVFQPQKAGHYLSRSWYSISLKAETGRAAAASSCSNAYTERLAI